MIVDNGSSDGSIKLLEALASTALCEVIYNDRNGHHGPALTKAISHVAEMYETSDARQWIWLLDSDCVVARDDTSAGMLEVATSQGAALLGEPHWDPWNDEERVLYCPGFGGGFTGWTDASSVWGFLASFAPPPAFYITTTHA